jgi:hypothetical protein
MTNARVAPLRSLPSPSRVLLCGDIPVSLHMPCARMCGVRNFTSRDYTLIPHCVCLSLSLSLSLSHFTRYSPSRKHPPFLTASPGTRVSRFDPILQLPCSLLPFSPDYTLAVNLRPKSSSLVLVFWGGLELHGSTHRWAGGVVWLGGGRNPSGQITALRGGCRI